MTMTDTTLGRPGPLERTDWGAFIDGGFVPVGDQDTFEVVEPSTARPLARVVSSDAALVDRAVRSARNALLAWRALSGRQRGAYLKLVADRIRAHADELGELVSRENGKPKRDALANEVLPPGVLNAVPGLAAGAALAGHPQVERISFTGATATGRRVLETAAQNLTYATMELGGKNALTMGADADLHVAVEVSVEGMFYNQGEACTSTARILLYDNVFDDFLARFAAAATALVVGDSHDPRTDVGPMVDARQGDRVLTYRQTALDEGPVSPDSTVGQEEIFGPIALIMRFSSIDEAVDAPAEERCQCGRRMADRCVVHRSKVTHCTTLAMRR